MGRKKPVRTRGKIPFSRYFQKLNAGDRVAIVREPSVDAKFSARLQGNTGVVKGMKGSFYIIKVKELNKEKELIIHPVHLKKINLIGKK